jgi:tryptophan synthase alpha chain
MNRIATTFEMLTSEGKRALIPYITPEFPLRGSTGPLLDSLVEGGADLIEVGIPFSDPLADGETIQHSSEIALRNGVNIRFILEKVRQFRARSDVPMLLMGYINPILRYGLEDFFSDCGSNGVDGVIIPDLPPEEADEVIRLSRSNGISNVFLIAPTTPPERIRQIDALSTHFSYCVSVTGVTGVRARHLQNGAFERFLTTVRSNVRKRFVVGFGISTNEDVASVWKHADGAVVGSALISKIASAKTVEEAASEAKQFLRSLRPTA